MNCFHAEDLPVINGLANAYAVCDYWFSSVPTQTFPNRSFIHMRRRQHRLCVNFWPTGKESWDFRSICSIGATRSITCCAEGN